MHAIVREQAAKEDLTDISSSPALLWRLEACRAVVFDYRKIVGCSEIAAKFERIITFKN